MIRTVYEATGERFYIIIDEWDALFREAKNDISIQKKYIDFLRELFKEKRYTKVLERHHYQGSALLIGISFETDTNHHRCRIEKTTINCYFFLSFRLS